MSFEDLKSYLIKLADTEGMLPLSAYKEAAEKFSLTYKDIEKIVLENGLFPKRYQRQRAIFGNIQQLRLLQARVAIVGCGGLGGSVFEMLVRLGVGHLLVIDPDFFVESNLNRQSLATSANLGRSKVEVAAEWGRLVNPVTRIETLNQVFQSSEAKARLSSCDLVFDALDSIPVRLELASLCDRHKLMLIHGAVAGWYGQVAPIIPGSGKMTRIYPEAPVSGADHSPVSGIEAAIGNLAPTVNAVAALQVAAGLGCLLASDSDKGSAACFIDLSEPELELLS
jgi:molybdopterin/thiamine biosynthesis adenylyltransferase